MKDDARKGRIIEAVEELDSALDEFESNCEPPEMGDRVSIALARLKAAMIRRQCELGAISDYKENFLQTAESYEKMADAQEKELDAREAGSD